MLSRCAFTLIEILVVIAIIVTLMGLLLGVVNTTAAEIAATQSTIQQVSGSIEMYKNLNGKYPLMNVPVSGNYSDTDTAKIASRNCELRTKLVSVSAEYDIGGEFAYETTETYAEPTPTMTPLVIDPAPSICTCIVDAWMNPLVYKPHIAYLTSSVTNYKPPKPRSFQIWSAGENEMYEMNSANADSSGARFETDPDKMGDSNFTMAPDDITNWTKVKN